MLNYREMIFEDSPVPLKRCRADIKNGKMYNSQWRMQEAIAWQMRKKWKDRPLSCAVIVEFRFVLEMPKSWSQKKKDEHAGRPCLKVPDLSNLIKFYEDAGNGIIWDDDKLIWDERQMKIWGTDPQTKITVRWLNEQ